MAPRDDRGDGAVVRSGDRGAGRRDVAGRTADGAVVARVSRDPGWDRAGGRVGWIDREDRR